MKTGPTTYIYKPLPCLRLRDHCGRGRKVISQRNGGFAVRWCFLVIKEPIPINFHQYDCLNMNWTRTVSAILIALKMAQWITSFSLTVTLTPHQNVLYRELQWLSQHVFGRPLSVLPYFRVWCILVVGNDKSSTLKKKLGQITPDSVDYPKVFEFYPILYLCL